MSAFAERIRSVLYVSVPKLLSGVASLGINLALMRFLSAEEFGKLSLCTAAILASDAILGSALDLAVLKEAPAWDRDDRARSVAFQQTALLLKVFGGSLLVALLLLGSAPLSQLVFSAEGAAHLAPLSGAVALGMLLLRTAQVHVQIRGSLGFFGALDLAHLLLRLGGVGLLIGIGRVSVGGVLVCLLIAPVAAFLAWAGTAGREVVRQPRLHKPMLGLLMSSLGWYLLTFGLSGLISRMDVFLLARWSGVKQVGIYAAASTLALMPQIIGSYLSVLFSPKITPLLKEHRFYSFFRLTQGGVLALTALSYLAFRLLWPVAAHTIFPASFARSGEVLEVLVPGALAGMATLPLTLSFVLFTRPRFFFHLDCLALPVLLGGYYFAIRSHGPVGAAWVTTAANVSRAAIAQIVAWRWARENDLQRVRL